MTNLKIITITTIYTIVIFSVGRYLFPYSAKHSKSLEINTEGKKVTSQKVKKLKLDDKKLTLKQKREPNGVVSTTRILEHRSISHFGSKKEGYIEKVSSSSSSTSFLHLYRLNLLGGINLTEKTFPISAGIHMTRPILGPVNGGFFLLSNGLFGITIGIDF